MRCKVNKQQLKQILLAHSKVVSGKPTAGILAGTKLEVAGGELIVTSTNLEQTLVSRMDARDCYRGVSLVSFKTLYSTVKEAADTIAIAAGQEHGKDVLRIDKLSVLTMPVEEYPETKEVKGYSTRLIDYNNFKDILEKIKCCISTDESRPALTGIYFDAGFNQVIATDSYKLAAHNLKFATAGMHPFVMPGKIIPILEKIKYKELYINITVEDMGKDYACIDMGDHSLHTRLITSKYPSFRPLLDIENRHSYSIDAGKLCNTMAKANKMLQDKYMPAIIDFNCQVASITKTIKEIGKYADTIDIKPLKDQEPLEVALNPNFLEAILKKLDGQVIVKAEGDHKPVSIKPDSDLEYLIMTIRVNEEVKAL